MFVGNRRLPLCARINRDLPVASPPIKFSGMLNRKADSRSTRSHALERRSKIRAHPGFNPEFGRAVSASRKSRMRVIYSRNVTARIAAGLTIATLFVVAATALYSESLAPPLTAAVAGVMAVAGLLIHSHVQRRRHLPHD